MVALNITLPDVPLQMGTLKAVGGYGVFAHQLLRFYENPARSLIYTTATAIAIAAAIAVLTIHETLRGFAPLASAAILLKIKLPQSAIVPVVL